MSSCAYLTLGEGLLLSWLLPFVSVVFFISLMLLALDQTTKPLRSLSSSRQRHRSFSRCAVILSLVSFLTGSLRASVTAAPVANSATTPLEAAAEIPRAQLFVVCTVNGHILVLDANTGDMLSGFTGGTPLIEPSQVIPGQRRIIPGLDGSLFVAHVDDDDSDSPLRPLDLTVMDVLQSPVKTCSPDADGQTVCGILTATKSTSLLALDALTGQLAWHQAANGTTTRTTLGDTEIISTVLLQREDVLIQQLDTDSGKSTWNASLGTVQALHFAEAEPYPPGDALPPYEIMGDYHNHPLPSVQFSQDGLSLTAVVKGRSVWKQDFPSVVASVFGLQDKMWKPLDVIAEEIILDPGASSDGLLSPPGHSGAATIPTPLYGHDELSLYQGPLLLRWLGLPFHERLDSFMRKYFKTYWKPKVESKPVVFKVPQDYRHIGGVRWPTDRRTLPEFIHHTHDPFRRPHLELPSPSMVPGYKDNISLRNGLFLTWPVMVTLLVIVLVFAGFVFRYVYIQKKNRWIGMLKQLTSPSNAATNSTRVPSVSFADNGEPSASSLEIPKRSKILRRAHSLPEVVHHRRGNSADDVAWAVVDKADDGLFQHHVSVHPPSPAIKTTANDEKQEQGSSTTNTAPTSGSDALGSDQGVDFLVDGIPLVRYNRYALEFTEAVPLGKGGFGTVFRCQNTLDGREYAIKKVMLKYDSRLPKKEFTNRLNRTLREVKSLALLDHPNMSRLFHKRTTLDNKMDFESTANEESKSYFHWRKNSINDDSLSKLAPCIPSALDDIGFTFDRSEASTSLRDETETSQQQQQAKRHLQTF